MCYSLLHPKSIGEDGVIKLDRGFGYKYNFVNKNRIQEEEEINCGLLEENEIKLELSQGSVQRANLGDRMTVNVSPLFLFVQVQPLIVIALNNLICYSFIHLCLLNQVTYVL